MNDPDVVGQISRMQNNINSLTQLVSQLTRKLNTVESELAAQKLTNTGKETCIKISLYTFCHILTHNYINFFHYFIVIISYLKNALSSLPSGIGDISYPVKALWLYCSLTLLNYFGFERTWLFQKRVVRTRYDIYVFFSAKK